MNDILSPLNDPQFQAVDAKEKAVMVLAGAGSGKTRVLTHRIARLLQQGVMSFEILAVTFTNKAAREMKSRIEDLSAGSIRGMWVGTFHGIAHRLLRQHWQLAGLNQHFQVLDSDDQLALLKRIMKENSIDDKKLSPKDVQWRINDYKDNGKRACHVGSAVQLKDELLIIDVYQKYETLCQRSNLVDFSELLLRAHELLRDQKAIREHYQLRFQHLLVDEFQDTNALQYAWLQLIKGESCSLFVVGDDDQSIYSWRGAIVENMQYFQNDFPDHLLIKLEQNYRSTQTILSAANTLISNNSGRLGKTLWTDSGDGEPLRLFTAQDDYEEASYIIKQIQSHIQKGYQRQDIAILYRSNAQSRLFEQQLNNHGIPYSVYGGFKFFDRAEIKDVLAYLRLLKNPHDDPSFMRVINKPTRGIGKKSLDFIRQLANDAGKSYWDAAQVLMSGNAISKRAQQVIQKFITLIESMNADIANLELADQINCVLEKSGILNFYEQEKGEIAQMRVDNLKELINAAGQFDSTELEYDDPDENSSTDPLTEFLTFTSLNVSESSETETDRIQMSTLHSAKGLEYPIVFMCGLEDGLFPHSRSIDSNDLEEERRLCYVGMTRAKEILNLSYAKRRMLYGYYQNQRPSTFLREIPKRYFLDARVNVHVEKPVYQGNYSQVAEMDDIGFKIGQHVLHKKFGEGVIMDIEGEGKSTRVQVNFSSYGVKLLVLTYANLMPLS